MKFRLATTVSTPASNRPASADLSESMRASDLFVQVMHRTLGERVVSDTANDSISLTQLLALRNIWLHPRVLIGNLPESLLVSYSSVTNLVNRLERMGLVLRVSNPQDRREVEVRLTESGLASIEKLERERIRRFDQVIQSMTAEDRNALLTGLGAFVVAAVGDDHQLVEDICLRCGSMASSDCPIARCQTVEFCT